MGCFLHYSDWKKPLDDADFTLQGLLEVNLFHLFSLAVLVNED